MTTPRCVLVTGGAGFMGSAFVRWILGPGLHRGAVVVLDALTYAGNRHNLEPVAEGRPLTFVHGDITDGQAVAELCRAHGVDAIVNFAAETHVDRSIHAPDAFVHTNVVGTHRLLEVARALGGIRFHQISTDEVYGTLGPAGRFHEGSPVAPRSPYAASKAAADHLVRAYGTTYGLPVTLTVSTNNYGPRQFPEKLIPLALLRALRDEPVPIYGDGQHVREWLYVDDHAAAVWTVLCAGELGRTYLVGSGEERTNLDLVHALLDALALETGRDPSSLRGLVTSVADRPGHDRRYALDSERIRVELGWRPNTDLRSGLRRTVRWYLDNARWLESVQSRGYRAWIDRNYGSR